MKSSEWKVVKLEDVCYFGNDKIETKMISLEDYISTENMLPNKGGISIASSLPSTKVVRMYEKNDVLISNIRPYFKKIWFARKIGGASNDVLILKGRNKKILDNKFMYYYLSQDGFFSYVTATAKGTKMPRGDKTAIMNYKINLPTIQEQENIVRILTSLDKKIEINNEINKKLEELAQAIFKHWFVDFEFPNENGEPYKSSGGEMVESELGMIPKGWNIGVLDELIEISSGKRPSIKAQVINEELSIPLVGASSIMGYTNEFNYNEPVLVIGRVGTHGIVQRFNTKIWASDNTLVIKSKYYEYVNQILNIIDYKALNRGSTQPLITQSDIKNYKIIIPDRDYLLKYEELVGSLFLKYEKNNMENENLKTIRDSLLPKLMSGEIRVPVEEEK
ncbi:restriction endonuclease subunit S [Caldibacillus thermoamylovorans]|uniref:restriction endonuclease subunit S n=1 Tax=Caldibacillus thermoamylovorans TaxID=35841 RepID=UPI0005B6D7D8|nr:restriction endonuclease subunit S [Caldibacillus thermoamylovorans]KIO63940.1 Type I restriction-modification system, specificity subunit S [Caldibacillus thermoamylovorans]